MYKTFDYIIIGGGLAGLQLALSFGRDRFFEQKSIAVIDPVVKDENDKTWCFWEKGESEWDSITTQSWEKGSFCSRDKTIALDLKPYSYKMVKPLDFYNFVKLELQDSLNITFIKDKISKIDRASCKAFGTETVYSTLHIFDSRIPEAYFNDTYCTKIFQHFKGWVIDTEKAEFDPSTFTMMDFRLKYKDSTSFTYVLPISEKRALIEFTFFTPYITEDGIYTKQLEKYISEVLKIDNYRISEKEKGVIPMTDYPFHLDSSPGVTKIGTGGSWVKGSTGYSFKHTEKKVAKIIANIKKGNDPQKGLINKRARFYDAIFLDVLDQRNDLGESIFTKLYSKNSPTNIFRFLDEETTFSGEVKIMFSLFHRQFLVSFFKKLF
jgi:lycopene beta-cyclase